VKDPVKP